MKNDQINKSISEVAENNRLPKDIVRDEMQKAIDAAWESKEHEAVKKQQELFPDGKPSVEDFVKEITGISKRQ